MEEIRKTLIHSFVFSMKTSGKQSTTMIKKKKKQLYALIININGQRCKTYFAQPPPFSLFHVFLAIIPTALRFLLFRGNLAQSQESDATRNLI